MLTALIKYPFSNTFIDYPTNTGNAIMVFMTGCDFNCALCQNPEMQSPMGKQVNLNSFKVELKEQTKRWRTNKVILTGGDPLSQWNIKFTKSFLKDTEYDVCVYTGNTIDFVKKNNIRGLKSPNFCTAGLSEISSITPACKSTIVNFFLPIFFLLVYQPLSC